MVTIGKYDGIVGNNTSFIKLCNIIFANERMLNQQTIKLINTILIQPFYLLTNRELYYVALWIVIICFSGLEHPLHKLDNLLESEVIV